MKNLIFTFLLLIAGISVKAGDAEFFNLDYDAVQQEFAGLNQVSDILAANPEMTYTGLMESNAGLVESVNLIPDSALPMGKGDPVLGIPSFLWGCVFGVVGLVVVYIGTEQDSGEAKKALYGCITSAVVSTIFYFLVWGSLFAAASTTG